MLAEDCAWGDAALTEAAGGDAARLVEDVGGVGAAMAGLMGRVLLSGALGLRETEAPAPTESTARLLSGGVAMTVSSTTTTPLTSAPYCSSRRRDIGCIWQPRKSV